MNLKRIILAAIVIGLMLIAFVLIRATKPNTEPASLIPPTFPIATTSPPSSVNGTFSITLRDGSSFAVSDFTKYESTLRDIHESNILYVAGDPGICQAGVSCTTESTAPYRISFNTEAQLFSVTLLSEPLGEARTQAEAQLASLLGVSPEMLCRLNYTVGTLGYVSEFYGGRELGFSFCPGSVKLP
jgi:hypothetical protein